MKIKSYFLIIMILPVLSCSILIGKRSFEIGKKIFEKSDVEMLTDKTVYLLPFESKTYVSSTLKSSKAIDWKLRNTILKAIKNFDRNKFSKGLEKRYSLKVDTTFFDRIWNDSELNSEYIDYLLYDETKKYKDLKFFKEIESLKESSSKNYIRFQHNTFVSSLSAKTRIYITIKINTQTKGPKYKFLTRNFTGGSKKTNTKNIFKPDVALIDYNKISTSISNIADYRYALQHPIILFSTDGNLENPYFDGSP